ncbi:MAG TPA: hypothetical protein VFQ36_04370, partial [Ktedonobacteraceae bacterium]|nr:hypothetical protein [Ktedonobacteraceae bacterium]
KMNKFLLENFSERSSVMSLRELLESIIRKAKALRFHENLEVRSGTRRQTSPTSHFHVVQELESLLSTLELNFFLTKYSDMSDRDGRKVTVFALNFGLCQRLNIDFGRPQGTDYRHYFVDRIFDFTFILEDYLRKNQEIVCDHCHTVFSFSELASLRRYRMKCPECLTGTCQVINLSKKYESILKSVDPGLLLPAVELGILQTLHGEKSPMIASDIAANLDYSRQLVAARGKILDDRGLVERIKNKDRREYKLTKEAEQKYFINQDLDSLDY